MKRHGVVSHARSDQLKAVARTGIVMGTYVCCCELLTVPPSGDLRPRVFEGRRRSSFGVTVKRGLTHRNISSLNRRGSDVR